MSQICWEIGETETMDALNTKGNGQSKRQWRGWLGAPARSEFTGVPIPGQRKFVLDLFYPIHPPMTAGIPKEQSVF
jgi:hypothetical protein